MTSEYVKITIRKIMKGSQHGVNVCRFSCVSVDPLHLCTIFVLTLVMIS